MAQHSSAKRATGASRSSRVSSGTAHAHEQHLHRELQRVLMQVPAAVCTTRGSDHLIESANLVYRELAGNRELLGRTIRDALPELAEIGRAHV